MSKRRKYGASAEIYFESQEQIDEFRTIAAALGLSLSAYIRQVLSDTQAVSTGDK
jgi:hypothetical protein